MLSGGFIKIHRKIKDNQIFWKPNYLAVFMYLLLEAEWQPISKPIKGDIVELAPGEVVFFQKELADRFKISIGNVNKILNVLKNETIIETRNTSRYSIARLINWAEYQDTCETKNEIKVKSKGNQSETLEEVLISSKNSKEIDILTFWNSKKVCVHTETPNILKEISKCLKKFSEEDIKKGISVYAEVFHSPDTFFKYKWTIMAFLKQSNGVAEFMWKTKADYLTKKTGTTPGVNFEEAKQRAEKQERDAEIRKRKEEKEFLEKKETEKRAFAWFGKLPKEEQDKLEAELDNNPVIQKAFMNINVHPEGSLMREEEERKAQNLRNMMKLPKIRNLYESIQQRKT